ncbi:acyl-CoA dehydrogenase family protein, partial [Nocardia sp. JCM 34519]
MGHYIGNVRDLEFNLFEVLGLGSVLDSGAYGELDSATVGAMLAEVCRLAEGPLGASFADADRNPPVFDVRTHAVTLPDSFKQSHRTLRDGGWGRLFLGKELGGIDAPRAVLWAVGELILGAQPAAFFYEMAGAGFANIFYGNATEEQRGWTRIAVEQGWGATMVLTEPDAGSDVGAVRTRAVAQADGSWHIEGVKRFITSADSDDLFP